MDLPPPAFKLVRVLALAAPVFLSASLAGTTALGQLRDSFESPQATWVIGEADCGVRVLTQERTYRESHSGQSSEHWSLAVGNGTRVFLVHPIGKAPIIPEFSPSLFLKSDRANLQLLVRIVFPRTIDRGTGRPLTTLLRGDTYTDVGNWQQLHLRDAERALALETVNLRTQFGSDVDAREAYADMIVVNAYSAPGNIEVWLDDLEIQGYVNIDESVGPQSSARPTPSQNLGQVDASPVTVQGSLLLVRGRPVMPRVIQHNGEPLAWLQSLGFNGVKLSASPSAEQLEEARKLGMWIIAPPPYATDGVALESLSPVMAWSLGSRLTERDLDPTQDLINEIRRIEPNSQRPLLGSVDSGLSEYSRLVSLIAVERQVIGTSLELGDQRRWLFDRSRLTRAGTPWCVGIPSEKSEKLAEQLILLSQGAPLEQDVDPDQLRLAAWHALASGARGLLFPSRTPLAIDNTSGAMRADALTLLGMELKLLEPWIAAGALSEELAAGDGSVQVSVLQTERSRLLLITQHAPAQQYVLGPPPRNSLVITIPGVSVSDRAYQVSLAGVKQLRVAHSSGGARLTLDNADSAMAVVITQDPLAMHHLNRTLAGLAPEAARLKYDLTARRLVQTADIDRELGSLGHPLVASVAWFRDAQVALEEARRFLEANDYDDMHRQVSLCERALAKIRRGHWEQAAASMTSPAASPAAAQFTTLPLHWTIATRLASGNWTGNVQTAGNMEALDQMLAAGWRQTRQVPAGMGSDVSLSLQNPHTGRSALRMQAWVTDGRKSPQIFERPLVWITSSPVPVRQGQLVRIDASINVPRPLGGSSEGLLVFESLSGPDLGDRIRLTQGWRELTLYRAVPQSGELTVTFALTGLGEASIDDLKVSLLDPDPIRPVR